MITNIGYGFPEIVQTFSIGTTYLGKPIRALAFAAPSSIIFGDSPIQFDTTFDVEANADKRLSILIDGAHHARELTTISMVLYTMIRVLHGYLNNCPEIKQILGNSGLYFIPIVNLDSVTVISDKFKINGGSLEMIRKNQHFD